MSEKQSNGNWVNNTITEYVKFKFCTCYCYCLFHRESKAVWGVQYAMGENQEVVWAKFSALGWAVLLCNKKMHGMYTAISKVENLAQVLSCQLKFVHGQLCHEASLLNI
jgi:hypothetical protein